MVVEDGRRIMVIWREHAISLFFLGSLIGRFFIYFFANCGFPLLLLLLQIGVLSLFFFSFRSVSTVHDGGMDGWRMDA